MEVTFSPADCKWRLRSRLDFLRGHTLSGRLLQNPKSIEWGCRSIGFVKLYININCCFATRVRSGGPFRLTNHINHIQFLTAYNLTYSHHTEEMNVFCSPICLQGATYEHDFFQFVKRERGDLTWEEIGLRSQNSLFPPVFFTIK